MIGLAVTLAWLGYGTGFYGYCLVKGYDVSFKQVFSPFSFYTGQWPPNLALDDVIIPQGGQGQPQTGGKNAKTTAKKATGK